MRKSIYKLRAIKWNQKGFTLVELLVSFALLLVLMTAALSVLSSSTGIYARIKAMDSAQSVSGILMDKIEGELTGADVKMGAGYTGIEQHTLTYTDKKGNIVVMSAVPSTKDQDLNVLKLAYNDVDRTEWYFSNNMYQSTSIEDITFQAPDAPSDGETKLDCYVTVTLKLTNTRTNYSYTRTKTMKCKNITY